MLCTAVPIWWERCVLEKLYSSFGLRPSLLPVWRVPQKILDPFCILSSEYPKSKKSYRTGHCVAPRMLMQHVLAPGSAVPNLHYALYTGGSTTLSSRCNSVPSAFSTAYRPVRAPELKELIRSISWPDVLKGD